MAITPYLLYEDVGGALKFLTKAFGFRKYGAQMVGSNRKINHAAMKLGDDVIMMGCPGSGYRNPKRLGQATQSLYVNVDDVDKHFERARKAGATIIDEPADTSYGQRRYGAEDPEGHTSRRRLAVRNRNGKLGDGGAQSRSGSHAFLLPGPIRG